MDKESKWWHGGIVGSMVTVQLQGLQFNLEFLVLLVWSFASLCFFQVFQFPPTSQNTHVGGPANMTRIKQLLEMKE